MWLFDECIDINIDKESMAKNLETKHAKKKKELKKIKKMFFVENDLSHFVSNKTTMFFNCLGFTTWLNTSVIFLKAM